MDGGQACLRGAEKLPQEEVVLEPREHRRFALAGTSHGEFGGKCWRTKGAGYVADARRRVPSEGVYVQCHYTATILLLEWRDGGMGDGFTFYSC